MQNILTCSYLDRFRDFAPTVLRVVTGVTFAVHGWQKVDQMGLPAVTGMVAGLGFPVPVVFAVLLIAAELGGGILLVLGAFTRLAAKSLIIVSLVALFGVHFPNGFSLANGGYEYILLLLAASVSLALSGAGKWSVDRAIWKK